MGLDGVMVVMETEKRFNIAITDQEAEVLRVVEDLHRLVMAKTASASPDPTAVWQVVQDIVVEELGVPRDRVKPGSTWRELGIT